MEAYRHFGLHTAPFEGTPDPRFYFATGAHAEVLATLQYAVYARKACTLVVGDSGSGKTLLGRMLVDSVTETGGVAWVHGIGQPNGETEVTVLQASHAAAELEGAASRAQEFTLAELVRTSLPAARCRVVVVDNADGLRARGWEDVVSLLTREGRAAHPMSIVLLGLPRLLEVLAVPKLIRLRRRVFRTCRLRRLTDPEVADYVRHRLQIAGAENADVFTPAALELIARFAGGNPALVNQICDNAMVDAFGDDRNTIDAEHVLATLHSITGGLRAPALPEPWQTETPGPAAVSDGVVVDAEESGASSQRKWDPLDLTANASAAGGLDWGKRPRGAERRHSEVKLAEALAKTECALVVERVASEMAELPLDDRLRTIEERLGESFQRVREARRRALYLNANSA